MLIAFVPLCNVGTQGGQTQVPLCPPRGTERDRRGSNFMKVQPITFIKLQVAVGNLT